jgi:hypothetical protein
MLKKAIFIDTLKFIEKQREDFGVPERYLSDSIMDLIHNYEGKLVENLNKLFDLPKNEYLGTDIDYYVYESNFGKNANIKYEGKKVDISCPEKLWDFLEEQRKVK